MIKRTMEMIKKGKEELPKGVKGERPMTNSNHASEEDKVSAYSPDEVQGIREELTRLQGDELYRRTFDLVNEGKLTLDDWHIIGYQGIYERLKLLRTLLAEIFDEEVPQ
jgi:hypothetical protein